MNEWLCLFLGCIFLSCAKYVHCIEHTAVSNKVHRKVWLCYWVILKNKKRKVGKYCCWSKPSESSVKLVCVSLTLLEDMPITQWVLCVKVNQAFVRNMHQSSPGSAGSLHVPCTLSIRENMPAPYLFPCFLSFISHRWGFLSQLHLHWLKPVHKLVQVSSHSHTWM